MLPSMMSVYFELSGYSTGGGTLLSSTFRGRTKHVLAGEKKGIDHNIRNMQIYMYTGL